CVRVQSNFDYW
nr:immunoglobulin heavy chain junction region [Macaca mulatta]MOV48100.1 immunoglobulin heavy chain junction region [Macaca mulatta]MOV48248.1 immunoglobulin heavy chain junction region [Macaca mulatta]MOV48537.1 immunoglobulin heavy chain junction region [Macaca mulatta]MOV48772.1 immunoglobulin heavy chain junction region [Macaca mulatta]